MATGRKITAVSIVSLVLLFGCLYTVFELRVKPQPDKNTTELIAVGTRAYGVGCGRGDECLSGYCGPVAGKSCGPGIWGCKCQGRFGGKHCSTDEQCESSSCQAGVCAEIPMEPEISSDTKALQSLVDQFVGTGRTLYLDRDYEVTTSIVINGPINIQGFSGTLGMDELKSSDGRPPPGKLPAIVMVSNYPAPVFNVGPGRGRFSKEKMCSAGCGGWSWYYQNRDHMMKDVSIKGVYVVGNNEKMTVHGLRKTIVSGSIHGRAVPGLPQRRALCLQTDNPFFPRYEYEQCTQIEELDFTRDAFNYVIGATLDTSAIGGYRFTTDRQCEKAYNYGCKNVKGSAITITAATGVTISDSFVVNGNSACISAFFNSADITVQRSRLHTAMYDGFGPDMIHDAKILDSVLGPFGGHASISISNGLDPGGRIYVANTHFIDSHPPTYVNSNNMWKFEGCTVDGVYSCDICSGPKAKGACQCTTRRAAGTECRNNGDCMVWNCVGQRCAGFEPGARCWEDGQCSSLSCSRAHGGACDGHGDCKCDGGIVVLAALDTPYTTEARNVSQQPLELIYS